MSRTRATGTASLPPTLAQAVDRACDRFEAAWRGGTRPRIEGYFDAVPEPARPAALRELLALELDYLARAGEAPTPQDYYARFPAHAELITALLSRVKAPAGPDPALPRPAPSRRAAGSDLLFGVLALQMDFISREALIAATAAWVRDKSRPLAQILVELGALSESRRALLEPLVREHLRAHDDDPGRSLASVAPPGPVRQELERLADPDVQASLALIPTAYAPDRLGPDDSSTASVGTATSDGQRFRILRPHAQGGLGAVFVALDTELHREVALKRILDHHADDPISRRRFLLEAEITGGLEHPGIVPVYGLGTHGDGRPYYAMRFIQGDSLKQAIEHFHADERLRKDPGRRSLELQKLLRRFTDACNAIEYAHSRGVLHRDLKPGNVIVGKYGETLVVDWGLAKAVGRADPGAVPDERTLVPSSSSSLAETLPGSALGTPAYMSPEQAAGELDRLGPRSDVYSLGATLYCLLTGRPPFLGGDAGMIVRQVQNGEFPSPRTLDPSIDPALEAVCLKAMATKPEDRYASCRALADDIERWLADEPVSARRDPSLTSAWRWVRHHRTFATSAAAVALVALTALGIALRRERSYGTRLAGAYHQVNDANTRLTQANAGLARANAEAERWLDRAMGSIEDDFTGVNEEALRGGKLPPALRDRLLARPRAFYEQLTRELAAKPEPSARERLRLAKGRLNLGIILNALGRNKDARREHEEALKSYEALASGQPADPEYQRGLAMSYHNLAEVLRDAGQPAEAADALRKAIAIWEAMIARERSDLIHQHLLAWSYHNLGELMSGMGRLTEASELYSKAIATGEALVARQPDVPDYQHGLAMNYQYLGNLLRETDRFAQAAEALSKAVAIGEALVTQHPDLPEYEGGLAGSSMNLGTVLAATGRPAEAVEAYKRAIGIGEKLVARQPDVPTYRGVLAWSYQYLGNLLRDTGRPAEAAAAIRKAIAITEALAASQPDNTGFQHQLAMSFHHLGYTLRALGRPAEAADAFKMAVAIREALVIREPDMLHHQDWLVDSSTNLGVEFASTGRMVEAADAHRRAIAIAEKLSERQLGVLNHRARLAWSYQHLGDVLLATGRSVQATVLYKKALTIDEALIDKQPDVPAFRHGLASRYASLGLALGADGFPADAVDSFREATGIWEGLVARQPDNLAFQARLAWSHGHLGLVLRGMGRVAEASRSFREELAISRGMADTYPDVVRFQEELARSHANIGVLLQDAGKPSQASTSYEQAQAIFQKLADDHPDAVEFRGGLANVCTRLARALLDIGRGGEARAACQRAVGHYKALIRTSPETTSFRSGLAEALLRSGQVRRAAGDVPGAAADWRRAVSLYEGLPPRFGEPGLIEACCHASLSGVAGRHGSGMSAAEGEAEGRRAVEMLRRLAANGFRYPDAARTESGLDPLRARPDFRLLMMDLAMPAEPFAALRERRAPVRLARPIPRPWGE